MVVGGRFGVSRVEGLANLVLGARNLRLNSTDFLGFEVYHVLPVWSILVRRFQVLFKLPILSGSRIHTVHVVH